MIIPGPIADQSNYSYFSYPDLPGVVAPDVASGRPPARQACLFTLSMLPGSSLR